MTVDCPRCGVAYTTTCREPTCSYGASVLAEEALRARNAPRGGRVSFGRVERDEEGRTVDVLVGGVMVGYLGDCGSGWGCCSGLAERGVEGLWSTLAAAKAAVRRGLA